MTCPITADRDEFWGAVTDADTDRADALDNDLGFLMENERAILLEHLAAHRQQAEASFKAREAELERIILAAIVSLKECGFVRAASRVEAALARVHTAADAGCE